MFRENNEIILVLLCGTLVLLLFFLVVVWFMFLYQNKVIKHQHEMSEQKLQSRRDMLAAAVEAQEAAFRNASMEMHDGISPELVSISYKVYKINTEMEKAGIQLAEVEDVRQMVEALVFQSRDLSRKLYPSVLSKFGLTDALKQYYDTKGKSHSFKVSYMIEGEYERLPLDTEESLYRIFQEVCTNTQKHAQANLLSIDVVAGENEFVMKLSDDGIGFNKKLVVANPGLGIRNIYARIDLMNAKADLITTPGEGVIWVFTIGNKKRML